MARAGALVSTDWALSFGTPVLLLDGCADGEQIYLTTKAHETDRQLVRIASDGHPVSSMWHEIDYGLLNLATGRIWSPANQQVANLYSCTGLPLVRGSLDVAVPPTDDTRLLDVGATNGGDPLVVYANWSDATAARYETARYDRVKRTWRRSSTLPQTGEPFWAKSLYFGGAVVSKDGTLVVSREAAETWFVERYKLKLGSGWTKTAKLARATVPIVRPYPVDGTASDILAQKLVRYNSYTDFCVQPLLLR